MFINKIGNLLKQERIKRNLTLKALSELSNISISTLSKIENNKIRNVNSAFLYRLCNILKIDYEYLTRQRWDILPTFSFERNRIFASK